jgi:hypothetical protein
MAAPFTLPDDIVAKIGNGDPRSAGAVLKRLFNVDPSSPTTVPASVVRAIGHGNINAGYRVLERFAQLLRQAGGYNYQPALPLRRYAKGGAVGKMSKADAGYEPCADSGRICAICSMFRENNGRHGCTLVQGSISRTATCNHFSKAA